MTIIELISSKDYLSKAFKYVVLNNSANRGPYHNLNHLMTVTMSAYEIASHEGIVDEPRLSDLLIACMFHDFNHSLGKLSDADNVSIAKHGVLEFIKKERVSADLMSIYQLLDATQYPYIIETEDLDIYQKIIRDADMTQVLQYDWIQQCVMGLSTELGKDFASFVESQLKFVENMSFNTSWGKKLEQEHKMRIIKETILLKQIMSIHN